MKPVLLIATIAFGLVLQGCGSVVIPTALALNAISPLEADPADYEVAVAMPSGANVPEGGATFFLNMTHKVTGESYDEEFILQRRESTDGRILFRVNPDDFDEIRALRDKAAQWEQDEPRSSTGAYGIFVKACRIGDGPDLDATFSVSIRFEVDGPFQPLIRNASVGDLIKTLNPTAGAAGAPIENPSPVCT